MPLGSAGSRALNQLTKQASPVLFGSARLAILTGQHIGIRQSPEVVGGGPGGKSIDGDKNS